jgi:hypothetical protein
MILLILFAACFAFVMIEVIRWQDYEDHIMNSKPFNFKPLNCVACLSGWTGIIAAVFNGYGFQSILFLPVCMVAGIAIEGLLKKL